MIKVNEKTKRRLILAFMITCSVGIFLVMGLIVDELTDDKPTQALCDDMFDLMGDPVHTHLHEEYVETMQLLHLFIQECHNNGNYDEDYDPNAMIGMNMSKQMNMP